MVEQLIIQHEKFMFQCLELAALGRRWVAPNPMVGAVLVLNGTVIGQGYHAAYGGAHAEVNAINSVLDPALLPQATLYVNLEPCNHHGNTPPCVDAVLNAGIKDVVVGALDSDPRTAGGGVARLRAAGVNVTTNICHQQCRELNQRFYTFQEKHRPYVILKWAQTSDGFIARADYSSKWISCIQSRALVHEWRSDEAAVLVGTNTAFYDNPALTARGENPRQPIRMIIDRSLRIPREYQIYNTAADTVIFNSRQTQTLGNVRLQTLDFSGHLPQQILDFCYKEKINSLFVEGGLVTLESFITDQLWDEARIFIAQQKFLNGIHAPRLQGHLQQEAELGEDVLRILLRE